MSTSVRQTEPGPIERQTEQGQTEQTDDGTEAEQQYLTMLYGRLDGLREQASERLSEALLATGGTPQARSERDSVINRYTDQVGRLRAVEQGLCFGRLDFTAPPGERRYVGRIGIFDEDGDYEPLLIDWRAPAARPFYLATAASPEGVRRRRHIRTQGRTVVGLDDEVLDLEAARGTRPGGLAGEAALMAAMTRSRTGRMRDIVETIQAEQDRVIRSDLNGVLVVQGGPGTGKTAVALHRAAYLLYTYREQLTQRGVLIVGPNPTFLRYISQVLPSLAETGVLLRTVGDLFPGVRARRAEPAAAAEVKGRAEMVEILSQAARDRQRVPDDALDVDFDRETLRLDRETCERARSRARRSGRPHNLARPIFVDAVIDALADQLAAKIGFDPYAFDPLGGDDAPGEEIIFDAADLAEIRKELRADPAVQDALDSLWPLLTPRQFLADLFEDEDLIASAAPNLTPEERTLLHRPRAGGWAASDAPLLDEAAELLGEDETGVVAAAEREHLERLAYAEGVFDVLHGSRSQDAEHHDESELLTATDLLDSLGIAERAEERDIRTAAERAAADRNWAFGHIIVDEAQELSPMAWRLLMRRCPARSMTVVGDVAQTGDLAGTSSWQHVLKPYVADRWRLAELTVSYRTPAEILALATGVLAEIDPGLAVPRAVRESGVPPWTLSTSELGSSLVDAVRQEIEEAGDGRVGVLVPAGRLDDLGAAVAAAIPDVAVGDAAELESRIVVLTVKQAKGLEFDSVIVVEPADLIAESVRGWNDLYVALTRATQRLGILHVADLPASLGLAA